MVADVKEIFRTDPEEINKLVLISLRPAYGAPDYIKKTRRNRYLYFIEAIKQWDEEKKRKLLDILTNIVSVPYFSIEGYLHWHNKIEETLDELKEFEELRRLGDYFKSLDKHQRAEIIEMSVEQLKEGIELIEKKLYDLAKEAGEDTNKIKELIVLTGYLEKICDLLMIEAPPESKLLKAEVLTLRFVAYLLGKIALRDLIMDLILHSRKKTENIDSENKAALHKIYEELSHAH